MRVTRLENILIILICILLFFKIIDNDHLSGFRSWLFSPLGAFAAFAATYWIARHPLSARGLGSRQVPISQVFDRGLIDLIFGVIIAVGVAYLCLKGQFAERIFEPSSLSKIDPGVLSVAKLGMFIVMIVALAKLFFRRIGGN